MTTILSIDQRRRVLRNSPVFATAPETELSVLAEMMDTEFLRADEVLFEQGDVSDRVYLVADGALDIQLTRNEPPVRTLEAGQLLGEYGLFSNAARTATVIAKTDTSLLSLDYSRFRAYLLQFPESTLVLLGVTVRRLTALEARLVKT